MIHTVREEDFSRIAEIYNHYVLTSTYSFEETPVSAEAFQQRWRDLYADYPFLVYEQDGKVIGFCHVHRWRPRPAYRFTVETTIYLDHLHLGKGIGSLLYHALFDRLKAQGIRSVIATISFPNEKSIRLHEKLGYVQVAHFKNMGYKFDRWIDVGYWQKML
jgi:L-amino acid N-acyltransferase YncA